jgi:hemerythrin-like metal-binding protein
VGFTELDRQHRHLFALLQKIFDARNDLPLALQALNRLNEAMLEHYSSEDRCMAAMKYPELDSHRREHLSFAAVFASALRRAQSRPSPSSVQEAYETLGDLMAKHILEIDVPLGKFLSEPRPEGSGPGG